MAAQDPGSTSSSWAWFNVADVAETLSPRVRTDSWLARQLLTKELPYRRKQRRGDASPARAATPGRAEGTLTDPDADSTVLPQDQQNTATTAATPEVVPEDVTASTVHRDAREREGIPVDIAGTPARQVDGTTCGAAVLVMLAATGDVDLADWLANGTRSQTPIPEIPSESHEAELAAGGVDIGTAAGRFEAAQRTVHDSVLESSLPIGRWPQSWGTPPWAAAQSARFPGVTYRSLPINDASDRAAALLASAHGATLAGVPVPMYSGGTIGRGLTRSIPRHVVLAVPPPPERQHRGYDSTGRAVFHIYDPSSAKVYQVRVADLLARREPLPALGNWTRICWILLPMPDSSREQS